VTGLRPLARAHGRGLGKARTGAGAANEGWIVRLAAWLVAWLAGGVAGGVSAPGPGHTKCVASFI